MNALEFVPRAFAKIVGAANEPFALRPMGLISDCIEHVAEVSKISGLTDLEGDLHDPSHRNNSNAMY